MTPLPPGFRFCRVMGFQLRCYGGQPPPCHVPALLCLLTWAVLATGLQGSIDSVFVERGAVYHSVLFLSLDSLGWLTGLMFCAAAVGEHARLGHGHSGAGFEG